ncbi:MAG: hypothetical protein JST82_01540 [Bacteroidetes bacterium]|nr:hypothetical protein [Bacteroidota bacterium]
MKNLITLFTLVLLSALSNGCTKYEYKNRWVCSVMVVSQEEDETVYTYTSANLYNKTEEEIKEIEAGRKAPGNAVMGTYFGCQKVEEK